MILFFVLCRPILASSSYVTYCVDPMPLYYLTSCTYVNSAQYGTLAVYENLIFNDVAFGVQSATKVVYLFTSGQSTAITSLDVTTITTLAYQPLEPGTYSLGDLGPLVPRTITYVPRGFSTMYKLTTFRVASYIPIQTAISSISVTMTDAVSSTVTASVCEGSEGTETRYVTGPVAGTSTITSCVSS